MITFNDLGLIPDLLDAISARGFEIPTPIQAEMIPFLLNEDRDVTGLAQTGTGKTAAFGLPILQKLDLETRSTQALILAPTRELGMQVSREIADYGRNLKGLRTATVYGGAPFGPQIRDLRAGAHIVTATPGRLKDLLDKGIADLSKLRFLILDEADQMLDMGFKDELDAILEAANPQRQTLLFSATMPREVARIASSYMQNPHEIVSGDRNRGSSNVSHYFYRVHASDKYAALRRLIDVQTSMYGIIFCRTREAVKEITNRLSRDGYAADALHGELSQIQRDSVMRRFREGNPALLVATDVAARGLDVDDLSHVVHYDLPDEIAAYTHRSGRTGRAGKTGSSHALVHLREGHKIGRIEQVLGRKIALGKIPSGKDICDSRLLELLGRVTSIEVNEEAIAPYLQSVRDSLEGFDREELLQRFISVEFNRFLAEYGDAPDLNPAPPPTRTRRSGLRDSSEKRFQGKGLPTAPMVCLQINLGRREGVLPPQLIGIINKSTQSHDIRLGRIHIDTEFSEIQVDAAMAERVEKAVAGSNYRGKTIRVKRVEGKSSRGSRPGKPGKSGKRGSKARGNSGPKKNRAKKQGSDTP
ncbi:DEAD/DEAH box helicase [Spirochaeta africana]|uniref:DNA/RNA helicase, superfamily II n=1 Tax=Spirochaeta africana (strain ATCC 700263 / DSM 8902 / Z-7692) TaxID=889378 RepID=H9UHG0_SPIAZ|nr:DEAD/DEAH box helicase [Spirochaeta africana]AFG36953.1 DNA/RNA helicase, superfamily II [Spirochaeta africana DSM 8902]